MRLWFAQVHRLENWSIITRLNELQLNFRRLGLRSTASRLSRCLTSYSKFKGNEMRTLLLFGYIIFKNVLKKKCYVHFLKLVVMMYWLENRGIHPRCLNLISRLGRDFVLNFSEPYSARHCVPVIHSLIHISDTVDDFDPLYTFTKFQFERELGKINKRFIYSFQ